MTHSLDDLSRLYVLLGLWLGQDNPLLVDAYYGPEELRAEAAAISDPLPLIDELEAAIEGIQDVTRRDFLTYQARALRTVARAATGEQIAFREHVRLLYDIEPIWTDESVFEAAHAQLDEVLPGTGSIIERRAAHRSRMSIPPDRVLDIVNAVQAELRQRVRNMVALPDGEDVEYVLVRDKPWSGYNWYLGDLRSRVELNLDRSIQATDLLSLIAHESYPGHHTEMVLKEQHLLRDRGYGEVTIVLLTSPQAVISEGVATNALEVVVAPGERITLLESLVLRPAGIDADAAQAQQIVEAGRPLGTVLSNAAILLHEYGRDVEEVVRYIQRYGLFTEAEARSRMAFVTDPEYARYVSNYNIGQELVRRFIDASNDPANAFVSLLRELWTPARLRAALDTPS